MTIADIDFGRLYREHALAAARTPKPAKAWDARAGEMQHRGRQSRYAEAFIARMDLAGAATLLDVGCGPGTIGLPLAARLERVYGLDYSRAMLDALRANAAERGLAGDERLVGYLADLVGDIIDKPGYRARRQSTPIACRSEALTRFVLLCDRWPGRFSDGLRAAALRAADENLVLQLDWYDAGQFRKGDEDDKVQIDYVQHNATAFLNRWLIG